LQLATGNFFEEPEHGVDHGSPPNMIRVSDDDDDVQEVSDPPPQFNIRPSKAKKSKPKSSSR
jgi:hypothetical protein